MRGPEDGGEDRRVGVEENMGDFTTNIYSVSSQMLVTIRIDSEADGSKGLVRS